MRTLLSPIAFAIVAAAVPAYAATPAEVFAKAKMTGVWAEDCEQRRVSGGVYEVVAIGDDGTVVSTLHMGSHTILYTVLEAELRTPTELRYRISSSEEDVTYSLVERVEGDRRRVFSSQGSDGFVGMREGKYQDGSERSEEHTSELQSH